MTWRLVVAIIGVLTLCVTVLSVYLPVGMRQASLDSAVIAGNELLRQVQSARSYYNETVVAKLSQNPDIIFQNNHIGLKNTLPLPATYMRELNNKISKKGFDVKLYSPYPWEGARQFALDAFEQKAWDALTADPTKPVISEENVNGFRMMRIAVADRMNDQKCVDCHNANVKATKRTWKLGDVRGVLMVTRLLDDELKIVNERADRIFISIILVSLSLVAALVVIARIVDNRTAEKHEAQQRIRHIAQHDALTGLMNRAYFLETVDKAIGLYGHKVGGVTVFYIDLDRFKEVNDGLGHAAGDHLLKVVSERLRAVLSGDDFISRLGGDEFTAASLHCETVQQAQAIGNALVDALRVPIKIGDNEVAISASIGILLGAPRFNDASEMLRAADIALYRAKDSGKNCAVLYSEDMDAELNARRDMEQLIRDNVERDGIEVFFQPLVHASSGIPCGFEALVRMRDCSGKLIAPDQFIPIAEEIGLINRIGVLVLRKSCESAALWPANLTVSVNLSPAQFVTLTTNSEPISKVVGRILNETGLDPHRLELEITEGIFLDQTDDILNELKALRQLGVHIVMDDFGTGYSSLAYLWKFPFDKLKIDQEFVRLLNEGDMKMTSFIRTMASLGHTLNMKVTAEGVETADQAAYLRVLGVDQLQGYYFGRPQPVSEWEDVLFGNRVGQPLGAQQSTLAPALQPSVDAAIANGGHETPAAAPPIKRAKDVRDVSLTETQPKVKAKA